MASFITDVEIRALRLWLWFKQKVADRTAEPWFVLLAFLESFFIPVPVDPFMAAIIVADRTRWWRVALLGTVSSTLGAVVGYGIGFFAFDYLGAWFAGVVDKSVYIEKMSLLFSDHALSLTFAAALTPIPNAPIVIAAGFVSTNLLLFAIAWGVARTLRFFGVAYIVYAFGLSTLSHMERVLSIGTVGTVLIVLGWYAYRISGV